MSIPISARFDGADYIYSIGPDVCLTPNVPVPYNSIAFLDTSIRVSRNVRNNSNHDFQLNSRASVVKGHEKGVGKGVIEHGYKTWAFVKLAEGTVFSDGWAIVRDGDPAWINRPDPGPEDIRRTSSIEEVEHH